MFQSARILGPFQVPSVHSAGQDSQGPPEGRREAAPDSLHFLSGRTAPRVTLIQDAGHKCIPRNSAQCAHALPTPPARGCGPGGQPPPKQRVAARGQPLPARPALQPRVAPPRPSPATAGSFTLAHRQPGSASPGRPTPVEPPLRHRGTRPSRLPASQPRRPAPRSPLDGCRGRRRSPGAAPAPHPYLASRGRSLPQ